MLKNLSEKLKDKNIRPSYPRLKVLQFLTQNKCHPDVEQIYASLRKEDPNLSKTTVYNTLSVFAETGLVRILTIEDNETRYDIVTDNHGHFKCESCGKIYDFTIDIDSCSPRDLADFEIKAKEVYFRGNCSDCLVKSSSPE